MKKLLMATICVLLAGSVAAGQAKVDRETKRMQQQRLASTGGGYTCGNDPILPTDGSSVQDYIGAAPNYYLVHLEEGHSYSAEMWDPLDLSIAGSGQLLLLSSSDCSQLSTTDFAATDPNLSGSFGDRISWRQAHNADAILEVNNLDPADYYSYVVRITDTTLQSSYWTTAAGLGTEFVFSNTTQQTLRGSLMVKDVTAGGTNYYVNVTVPAGQQVMQIVAASSGLASQGLQLPANHTGRAAFTFTGPSGGILADAYTVSVANVPVAYMRFDPKFSPH